MKREQVSNIAHSKGLRNMNKHHLSSGQFQQIPSAHQFKPSAPGLSKLKVQSTKAAAINSKLPSLFLNKLPVDNEPESSGLRAQWETERQQVIPTKSKILKLNANDNEKRFTSEVKQPSLNSINSRDFKISRYNQNMRKKSDMKI